MALTSLGRPVTCGLPSLAERRRIEALLGKPAAAPRAAPGDLPPYLTNRRSTNAARGPGRSAEIAGTQQLLAGHPWVVLRCYLTKQQASSTRPGRIDLVSRLGHRYMETRLPSTELDAVRQCFHREHLDESFYALVEKLLWRNEAVASCLDAGIAQGTIPEDELNDSQLTLETVALLDLEVPNGGLLQFFWNRPPWIDRVSASLRSIGLPALADAFERSTAELVSRVGTYSEFRKRDSLQAYSECASEFSFDDFDSAYYDHGEQVYAKTLEFVSLHLGDFVD
jgi:hypothetical protein